jgi:hypothetical protein
MRGCQMVTGVSQEIIRLYRRPWSKFFCLLVKGCFGVGPFRLSNSGMLSYPRPEHWCLALIQLVKTALLFFVDGLC